MSGKKVDDRITEAKGIIGLAWSRANDKNLTLHKALPPLTNYECFKLGKDMQISYTSLRKLAPKKKEKNGR